MKNPNITVRSSEDLVRLVKTEIDKEETSSYAFFTVVNVEACNISDYRLPKDQLHSVAVKGRYL